MRRVKGFEPMLTAADVAAVLRKPVRFVRESLLATGCLKAKRMGGNSWRVDPAEFRAWLAAGQTGFRFARASGGRRAARRVAAAV